MFLKRKIVFITQGVSPIVSPILSSGHQVVGIVESAARGYIPSRNLYSRFRKVVNACLLRINLNEISKRSKIPYFLLHRGNNSAFKDWLTRLQPDLIIISSMSQLLSSEILDIPRLGTLNLHPSLLPDYRGPNPYLWIYMNMEKYGGVTLHYVDKGEDTGYICYQRRFPIPIGLPLFEYQSIATQHSVKSEEHMRVSATGFYIKRFLHSAFFFKSHSNICRA